MAEQKKRRVHAIVEESRHWDAQDLLRNLEDEMRRMEKGLGHVMFDSEGRPATVCVSPLPARPKFETNHEGDEFSVKIRLPSVEKDDVRVFVNRDSVEVRAVSGKRICRPYYLNVDTPWNVDPDSAEVRFDQGVLVVKAKKLRKKRVPIT